MKKYQKIFVGISLSLFVFGSAGVKTAKAITIEEIKTQIAIILAKVQEIQRQLNELIANETTPLPKSITLVSPASGEKWETGKTYDIKWDSTGYSPDSKIKINILDERKKEYENGYELNITDTNNTGSYSWKIPDTLGGLGLFGSLYKIVVYAGEENDKKSDASDNYFIISAAIPSYLNVISPNGGEIWQNGKTYTIKWDSLGMENYKTDIILKNLEVETLTIANHIPNSNYYNWQVPQNLYGNGYKITIKTYNDYGTFIALSSSGNNFTIIQAISSKNIEQQLASISKAIADLLSKAKELIVK